MECRLHEYGFWIEKSFPILGGGGVWISDWEKLYFRFRKFFPLSGKVLPFRAREEVINDCRVL